LQTLVVLPDRLKGRLGPIPFRRILYEYGAISSRDAALLRWADDQAVDLEPALAAIVAWEKPVFPLQGSDILKLGLPPGPEVGTVLRSVEEWWMDQDFRPDRAACLAAAQLNVQRAS
jgi:poly(A) polymerase